MAAIRLTAGVRHRIHIDYRANRPLTNLQPGGLLLQWRTPAGTQAPGTAAAVAAAKKAEVAVVYARTFETDERDRVSLKLPQSANELISAVAAANPRTIVVLASGGPVTMPWLDSVEGVVQNYFGGQAQGAALADVHVRLTLTNTGARAGTETAQVYLGLPPRTGHQYDAWPTRPRVGDSSRDIRLRATEHR